MSSPLQSKIASAMWAMAAVGTLAATVITGALLVSSHRESVQKQLQATAASLVTLGITRFSELKDFSDLNRFIEDSLQMDRVDKVIRVYGEDRKLIFTTAGSSYDVLPNMLERKVEKPAILTLEGKQRSYESIVVPYEGERSRKVYYLQVAIPLPKYSDVLEDLWWQMVLLIGLLIGVSVLLAHWLSRRLLMPVGKIAEHLKSMDPARIESWRPIVLDEGSRYLMGIADGINLLAERTRAAMAQIHKMSRYVAHEMRTPLTILQGEAEMALAKPDATGSDYERVLRSSLEEVERMSEIVSTVLEVGDSARPKAWRPVELCLSEWLRSGLPLWEKTLGRSIELDFSGAEEERVMADPRLLGRLVDNLVRNVRKHAKTDAICSISLKVSNEGRTISIADDGPGLDEGVMESLNSRGGFSEEAGVGLNLCHRIADLLGFKLFFCSGPAGGLKVEIRL